MIQRGVITIEGSRIASGETVIPEDVDPASWNADRWERAVLANLTRLERSRVGAVLLRHVVRPVTIIPFRSRWHPPGGRTAHDFDEHPHTSPPEDPVRQGTGLGARHSFIEFMPAAFSAPIPSSFTSYRGVYPFETDHVLFHELFHILEAHSGRARSERMQWVPANSAPISEHRAVLVTNMYLSENLRPLRGPYGDVVRVSSPRSHYWGYRTATMVRRTIGNSSHDSIWAFWIRLVGEMMTDHPVLTADLSRVARAACHYNPFRDFWDGQDTLILVPDAWAEPVDQYEYRFFERNTA